MKSKSKQHSVALVIPAFNESAALSNVIEDLKRVFHKTDFSYEIVVVDDGSHDNTASIAEANGAFVIRHIMNTGSGGATATGLSYAQQYGFNLAATLDGDGQHHAEDVLKGLDLIMENQADLLIGSRLIDSKGMSRVKVLGNKGLSTITNIIFGVAVTDSQSGLRIFSKNALEKLKWETSGYEFASEMLWRAKQQGLTISEYPIKAIYTDYSRSKGQNNWNAVNIIKSLLKTRVMEFFGE